MLVVHHLGATNMAKLTPEQYEAIARSLTNTTGRHTTAAEVYRAETEDEFEKKVEEKLRTERTMHGWAKVLALIGLLLVLLAISGVAYNPASVFTFGVLALFMAAVFAF
jgi:hypothetical protein